jgi:hypothetical protein
VDLAQQIAVSVSSSSICTIHMRGTVCWLNHNIYPVVDKLILLCSLFPIASDVFLGSLKNVEFREMRTAWKYRFHAEHLVIGIRGETLLISCGILYYHLSFVCPKVRLPCVCPSKFYDIHSMRHPTKLPSLELELIQIHMKYIFSSHTFLPDARTPNQIYSRDPK